MTKNIKSIERHIKVLKFKHNKIENDIELLYKFHSGNINSEINKLKKEKLKIKEEILKFETKLQKLQGKKSKKVA